MDRFGNRFALTVFGESHGSSIGVVIDGVKAGISLCEEDFTPSLDRRRSGAKGTTNRHESDQPHIVSGLFEGHTTGAPLTIVFDNSDTRSGDYAAFVDQPRPSHADLTAMRKFDSMNDPRGGGHFSGRLTLTLVAAGVVARKMLPSQMSFDTRIVELGGSTDSADFDRIVADAVRDGDSVGGVIETTVEGVPVGTGEPFFDSVESVVSHILFAIPAVKGVEFGSGFGSARLRGSQNNDPIVDRQGKTATNHDGGVNGGIANGNPIVVRAAIKPTPSIARAQQTYSFGSDAVEELVVGGRHDACIALRAAVVVESAVAIALVDLVARGK